MNKLQSENDALKKQVLTLKEKVNEFLQLLGEKNANEEGWALNEMRHIMTDIGMPTDATLGDVRAYIKANWKKT